MTYKVIRFSMTEPKEVIKTGLTLEEAQEHCGRDDTHGDGWFDGYDDEDAHHTQCIMDGCTNAVPVDHYTAPQDRGTGYCDECITADMGAS